MSDNVFRFSMSKDNPEMLVDMNAVEDVVRLSKEAVETYNRLENAPDAEESEEGAGLKKFIREQIDAVENDGQTRHVRVLDENGLADFIIEKAAGKEFAQIKCEYERGRAAFEKCRDIAEVIYMKGDSPKFEELKAEALRYGVKEIKSTICSSAQCKELAELMHVEERVSGIAKAVFFPHEYTRAQAMKLIEIRGIFPAVACAKIGGAVAIASSIASVISGEKTVEEAAESVAKDYAEEMLLCYAGDKILTAAVGNVIRDSAMRIGGTAIAEATGLLNTTAAGAAILKGGTAVLGTVGTMGSTALGMISTGAGMAAAGAGMVATGAVAAASFAAPVVVPVAIVYGAYKFIEDLF